jgi:CopG family transcriptional regulator, nickel-responsive regulator
MPIVSTFRPDSLRDELDHFAADHGYDGQSELIREACQSLLDESQTIDFEGRDVIGTVTAVFGYDESEIERRMMEIRYEYESEIRSNSHNCLTDNSGCVETFILEVKSETVSQFVETVRAADECVTVRQTLVPVDTMDSTVETESTMDAKSC